MRLPPRFMFVETNKRCNLRCTHCDFWQRNDDDRANYLSRERKREVIAEFAELSPAGTIVICGGEPMLDLDEYFAICRDGRDFGLRVLSVVNGTRIRTPKTAERMVREGPHEISISLNAHRRELHDRTRGVPGAFDKAVKALRLLVDARDANPGLGARIIVMGLVFGSNYRDIGGFYDFVLNDIRADALKLNFLQPAFGQQIGAVDPFFAAEAEVDPKLLLEIIDESDERFGLGLNPAWRENVGMYFRSLAGAKDLERGWGARSETRAHICNTYDRNIMVNHYGMARLCFSTSFRGQMLEKRGDLIAFWENSEDIRRKMRRCNKFCGISHSVRAESSTLAGKAKAEEFRKRTVAALGLPEEMPVLGARLRRLAANLRGKMPAS